jgi:hypothetical protein
MSPASEGEQAATRAEREARDAPEAPAESAEPAPEQTPETPETPEAPLETPADRRRRRWMRIGLFLAFLATMGLFVMPRVPRSQHVRVHLGPGSSRVVRLTARVSRGGALDRETAFRFERGAPPALGWDFELPNGGADVEVELVSAAGIAERTVHVDLAGEETTVEIADAVRTLP